jgi:hypothetical protein
MLGLQEATGFNKSEFRDSVWKIQKMFSAAKIEWREVRLAWNDQNPS